MSSEFCELCGNFSTSIYMLRGVPTPICRDCGTEIAVKLLEELVNEPIHVKKVNDDE